MTKRLYLPALLILVGTAIALPAGAQWVEHGIPVCTYTGSQETPRIVFDTEGGAIIAWRDQRAGGFDIYAQRIDARGNVLWTVNGVGVCTHPASQPGLEMIADGVGGAVLVWYDQRNGNYDIYTQRIDSDGVPLWAAGGVAICTATGNQMYPVLARDGGGGAIIAWLDPRSTPTEIYVRRVDGSGTPLWAADGITSCSTSSYKQSAVMVEDGFGGAYIVWKDDRNGNWDIYGMRVSGNGAYQWASSGYGICDISNTQGYPAITSDGDGGMIVAWQDHRSGTSYDIYAQRMTVNGVANWVTNGVIVSAATNDQTLPRITSDGLYGAIVTWRDSRASDDDIYSQRINYSGTGVWTAHGESVCSAAEDQDFVRIVADGQGGAIITWRDYRYSSNYDVYAQRMNPYGAPMWATNGAIVGATLGGQYEPCITSDGQNGAIIAFLDTRTIEYNIYAQRMERNGYWGYPAPLINAALDIPGDEGGFVNLTWHASRLDVYPEDDITYYTVWRAIEEAAAMALVERGALLFDQTRESRDESDALSTTAGDSPNSPVVRRGMLGSEPYFWFQIGTVNSSHYVDNYSLLVETVFDSTDVSDEQHYFQIIAHESDPTGFWISAVDSGYSVDNLAPCPPLCLAGEQNFVPEGLTLSWTPNTEPDLDCYRIYRGTAPEFTPGPGNFLDSPCDTIYYDGGWDWSEGYCYKVCAVDVHGNESGYALLCSELITGDDPAKTPTANFLAQNFPNPFNPLTTIAFGLEKPADIRLCIYDASGRLVCILAEESRKAGPHKLNWNGKDKSGTAVSSGIYFYRLVAGDFVQTRKMVLLR